ncbi:hypothetical protein [Actinomadura rubrisoli]|uniref:Uncharacterized protein n=1 Tax=Actinomadura rubrisoli TaxID=2530368 RepID=A0A4R5C3A9_9ACTN|nr:hypothetical protein [Actinomadura rubrisoli]TDD94138.1 hypothetical protein E1298_07445 [Actinomadura rubrisoli]
MQSDTGDLFRVEPSGMTRRVNLHGETLAEGDGLLLRGRTTLYAVQNPWNAVAVLSLNPGGHPGPRGPPVARQAVRRPGDRVGLRLAVVPAERPFRHRADPEDAVHRRRDPGAARDLCPDPSDTTKQHISTIFAKRGSCCGQFR